MKLILKHSENIKTFANISHHLELKAKCMGGALKHPTCHPI